MIATEKEKQVGRGVNGVRSSGLLWMRFRRNRKSRLAAWREKICGTRLTETLMKRSPRLGRTLVRGLGVAAATGFFAVTAVVNAQAPVITNAQNLNYVGTNEAFDATSNTWTAKSPMPTVRPNLMVGEVNGILYAVGGLQANPDGSNGPIALVEAYDPATDTWTTKTPMPEPLSDAAVATLNGILYVAGGQGSVTLAGTLYAYDPSTDTWTSKAPMSEPRGYAAAGVIDGKLYVVGGNTPSEVSGKLEVYDPATDSWTTKSSTSQRGKLRAAVVSGVLYAIGGQPPNSNSCDNCVTDDVEAYDPTTDQWTQKTPIPTGRAEMGIGTFNNMVYVFGGEAVSYLGPNNVPFAFSLNDVEAYDPTTDSWSEKAPMPTPRQALGGQFVNGIFYAIGGDVLGTSTVGQTFIYQVTATNHPTSYGGGGGVVVIDATTGIMSISTATPVSLDFEVSATNASGTGTGFFHVIVQPAPSAGALAIVNNTSATGRTGQPFSFQLLTTGGSPATHFSLGGIPPGLSVDQVTGLISGTPTSDGNFAVAVTAIDGAAKISATLQLTFISDPTVPIINSPDHATLVLNQPFSYTITADVAGNFSYIGIDGQTNGALPPGLMFVPPATISGIYMGSIIPLTIPLAPDTIKIRPPLIATGQPIANNSNGTGTGPLNFFQVAAGSRKTYGAADTFDIALPLSGTPGIECRSGGANGDYQVVFAFSTSVTFGSASVTPGQGGSASVSSTNTSADGKEVSVNLTNVSDGQQLTVTLSGVQDGVNSNAVDVAVQMGVLVGDVTGNGSVNSSDISLVKAQSGQPISNSNYRADVTGNGIINSADISLVKSRSGASLQTAARRKMHDDLRRSSRDLEAKH
jgi:N-acetylneuraminic acid mutarotase